MPKMIPEVQALVKHLFQNPADIGLFQNDPKAVFNKIGLEPSEELIAEIKKSMGNLNLGK